MSEAADDTPLKPAGVGGGSKKLLMVVLVFNMLIAAGLGYLVLAGQRSPSSDKAGAEHSAEGQAAEGHGEKGGGHAKFGPLLEVGSFVANLASVGGPGRYAKVTLHIEATSEETKAALEHALVPIRSEALMFLSNTKPEEVVGQDKIRSLSEQLLKRIQQLVGKDSVKRVYFSELVVQ